MNTFCELLDCAFKSSYYLKGEDSCARISDKYVFKCMYLNELSEVQNGGVDKDCRYREPIKIIAALMKIKVKNNFCHFINCSAAETSYIVDGWKCFNRKTNMHYARCNYFNTSGEIDSEYMNRVKNGDDPRHAYRNELQIIVALIKVKHAEKQRSV